MDFDFSCKQVAGSLQLHFLNLDLPVVDFWIVDDRTGMFVTSFLPATFVSCGRSADPVSNRVNYDWLIRNRELKNCVRVHRIRVRISSWCDQCLPLLGTTSLQLYSYTVGHLGQQALCDGHLRQYMYWTSVRRVTDNRDRPTHSTFF